MQAGCTGLSGTFPTVTGTAGQGCPCVPRSDQAGSWGGRWGFLPEGGGRWRVLPKPNKEQERSGTEGCGSGAPALARRVLPPTPPPDPQAPATADEGSCGRLPPSRRLTRAPQALRLAGLRGLLCRGRGGGARPCGSPAPPVVPGSPGPAPLLGGPWDGRGSREPRHGVRLRGREAYACLPSLGLKSQGGLFLK